ncbi:substance-K receptor-like [Diadema antillarum]|uniref:substance-K receptor-like n=1 Tax=Diadema antillarum TaxID=105358 RepID=UPI003A89E140
MIMGFPSWMTYLFGVVSVVIALVAVFGNASIIVAIFNDRRLRTYTNCFIIGLAISDVCNGIEVGFRSVNTFMGYWPFGRVACELLMFFAHYTASLIIMHSSFAINPICYATGNPLIRAALVNLVCRRKKAGPRP